mgnify:FL=1
MKKSIKILSVLMMSIMMVMTVTPVFASNQITPIEPTNTGNILQLAGKILGFLQWIALIGGTIIIAILGIKYMMGSLEERADYKKSFIPLIVGIIVVMGAVTIANLIVNTFTL